MTVGENWWVTSRNAVEIEDPLGRPKGLPTLPLKKPTTPNGKPG